MKVWEGIRIEITDTPEALFGSYLLSRDSTMLSYPTWPQPGPLWVSVATSTSSPVQKAGGGWGEECMWVTPGTGPWP